MKTTSDRQSNLPAPSPCNAVLTLFIAFCALAFANFATAATYTWNNAVEGDSTWSTDGNWVAGNTPQAPPSDSSLHTLLFDATAPGTSDMDGNYAVGTLSYTADGHTTDLNSNTLTPGAISFANNTDAVVQNGSLVLGQDSSPVSLTVGSGANITQSLALSDVELTAYLSILTLGKGGNRSVGYGTLDLTSATLADVHSGTLQIEILDMGIQGYKAGLSSGSLLFSDGTGINLLKITDSFVFRDGNLGQFDGSVYKLPSTTSLTLGISGDPIDVTIGQGSDSGSGTARVIMTGGTFEGYINNVTLGLSGWQSTGTGTLDLTSATLAAVHNGTLEMNALSMGQSISYNSNACSGSLLFSDDSGINHLVIKGDFLMASGNLGEYDALDDDYKLPANTSLTIGQSGAGNEVAAIIGDAGTFGTARANVIMTGGEFKAYLSGLTLGYGGYRSYGYGTLDLSQASSVDISNTGATIIGQAGSYGGLGTVKLPTGTFSTGALSLVNGTLDLAGTTFSFTDTGESAVSIGTNGTLSGYGTVSGSGTFTSTGYVRADTGTLDLTGLTGPVSIDRLYAQNGGTLALPDAAMTVTTLDVGSTGGGTVNLNGTEISMGANSVTVASNGVLTGHGSISGATLTMNGTVRASGGTLDLSGFTTVASSTGSGWLVENGGAITLPATAVAEGNGGDFIWGAQAAAVNSVQLDFTNVTGGNLSISVLDPDTIAYLPAGTLGDILSLWEIDGTAFIFGDNGTVDLVFHYDDSRLGGLDESLLKVFHYTGSAWEELVTAIDTGENTATVTGVNSFSPFAVGINISGGIIPEPASLALLGLGAAWLLNRRRGRSTTGIPACRPAA